MTLVTHNKINKVTNQSFVPPPGFDHLMYVGAAIGAISRGATVVDGPRVQKK